MTIGLILLSALAWAQKPVGDFRCGHTWMESSNHKKANTNFDINHYSINLDMTDFDNQTISGFTKIIFTPQEDLATITLNLEGLTVDSILYKNEKVNHSRNGIDLEIDFGKSLSRLIQDSVYVYYHGKPIKDQSWGGFYYSGEYAFNLGVGFTSNPHNYGRVWFPCVDNFQDRATYDFAITTTSDKKALCNGLLKNETANGNGTTTFYWQMRDEIPTYLASVAVAPYSINQWTHANIPIVLACTAADSTKMAASFVNLNNCIDAYQNRYGSHTFERIGFNAVPFNGGAMEHATNIAYPIFAVNGNLDYETLYAHEFGHHWWGNTVTCSTAEDMWINEGWASYSERLFLEWVYGKERYDEDISANHKAVLHYAHLRDGDTLPISGIDHAHTYGMHVYDKGADMVHTLRGYMGDSAFFQAIRSFMVEYKFQAVNTDDLKNHFQKYTSENLDYFFEYWINKPGFPHLGLVQFETEKVNNAYSVKVYIEQNGRFTNEFCPAIPIEVTIYSANFEKITTIVRPNSKTANYLIHCPFLPVYVALDFNKKLSDAITDDWKMIKDTGSYGFGDAMMSMQVKTNTDSSLVRVEHNWIGANTLFQTSQNPVISKERYWTIDGIFNAGFSADATIEYNGLKPGANYALGYLDSDLIRGTEDSLTILYRPTATSGWEVYPDLVHNMGSKFDKRGSFTIKNVKKGQYALAYYDCQRASVQDETVTENFVTIYPNPATETLNIDIKDAKNGSLEITDINGKIVYSDTILAKKCCKPIDVSGWTPGVYFVGIVIDNRSYKPKLMVVR
ncbi:MAG: M1 family aminopeptidase [Bacteroidia bacterium]